MFKHHHEKGDGHCLHDDVSKLLSKGCANTILCDPLSNLLMFCTEHGASKLYNLIQVGDPNGSLTSSQ